VFLPDTRPIGPHDPKYFLEDRQRRALIPGSSLKGLFRNVIETVSGGAWWFAPADVRLPREFQPPRSLTDLDAACRMFGFLDGRTALLGRVMFDDGLCENPTHHEPIYTCILSSPKPRHAPWYEDRRGYPAGRKYYFHATRLQTVRGWQPQGADRDIHRRLNQYIRPLDAGNVFHFQAQFTNLEQDDVALLLYALVLEPTMRHKIGYAKPAGLGSVQVQLDTLELVDYTRRYRGGGGKTRYERAGSTGDTLTPFVAEHIAPLVTNTTNTLQDLRRIWQWPPIYEVRYPTQNWFDENPTAPISQTP
jgi:CRISPR-associated protein (TIGR03986 family)